MITVSAIAERQQAMIQTTKRLAILSLSILILGSIEAKCQDAELDDIFRLRPVDNIIPDEATAVKLALVILEARFGASFVAEWHPYSAELVDDKWFIRVRDKIPDGFGGGHPEMALSRTNGAVHSLSLAR